MEKELEKTYNPKELEDRLYKKWEDNGYFKAEVRKDKKPFTIVMPPPNITGKLHMGHALDNTMQDILIRFKRMQGYEALWQPGTDHASIATEVKIINALREQGIEKQDLGREKFLERAWEWKEEYGNRIISQLKKLGSSADWSRERFTMDEGCSKAVEAVFVNLYNEGYIYKGERIINWCPTCMTTISDAEVVYDEGQEGHFWYIKYPIKESEGEYLVIATTRPETMLGDEAIAVNPEDKRYKNLVGKTAILPIVNKEIPIIADSYVDVEFGTGAVKITPAHDPNDFEVGKRHNLPVTNIFNDDATINKNGGSYEGLDRFTAREKIVKELKQEGLLLKVEPLTHNVGTHDRCSSTIEPMVKPQWFVKMEDLAAPAIKAIKDKQLEFVPERFNKIYLHWLTNIRDWCISRQLWWGHRIPAYYCSSCGNMVVEKKENEPKECPKCGGKMKQDEDTLDTWFSSALWPFSTLGWPEKTEEMEYFYPTDVLVTGYDIIFFWVVRMVFSALKQTKKVPFQKVLIHGLVRDSQGRKMSKSLGNGIDPLEIIDKYGADALRLTLITGNAPGNDMRFYLDRVETSRNFANKVWNASRFIIMNLEGENAKIDEVAYSDLLTIDRWIISRVNTVTKEVTEALDKFELGIAVEKVYDFIWDEFCDWYIELVKGRIYNKSKEGQISRNAALQTLTVVLKDALKLLHPYMPFITEEIYCTLSGEESIMISSWPTYKEEREDLEAEKAMKRVINLVKAVRNLRTDMNVPPSKRAKLYIVSDKEEVLSVYSNLFNDYKNLAGASEIIVAETNDDIHEKVVSTVVPDASIYIPLEELIDLEKEKERLLKEEKRLISEVKRSNGMLNNQKFLEKAPKAKVDEEKEKLKDYENMLIDVRKRLSDMQ